MSGRGGTGGTRVAGTGGTGREYVEVDGGVCCPPDERPGCCMDYGGFAKSPSMCFGACDSMPLPNEAWRLIKDEHGCDVWMEPDVFSNCCGCDSPDGAYLRCNPVGTWSIQLDSPLRCGPRSEQTITITADDDAGTPEIAFAAIAPQTSECSSTIAPSGYEATVTFSEITRCMVRAAVHSKWCSHNEPQCEDLELTLYLRGEVATVEGSYRRCWCGSSGPEGSRVEVSGTARRL